jgi:predicted ABC-type ATPase
LAKRSSHVVVLAGPNGAGKTTLAPKLLRDVLRVGEFVNADVLASGLSAFDPERAAAAAGRVMLQRLHELAEQRVSFAFETTLASRSFAAWLARLREAGYRVHIVFLWLPSADVAVKRVADRFRMGGHAVPEEAVRRRFGAGLRNFFGLYQPLADTWRMYDNSRAGAPRLIANGRRSEVSRIADRVLWRSVEAGREGR